MVIEIVRPAKGFMFLDANYKSSNGFQLEARIMHHIENADELRIKPFEVFFDLAAAIRSFNGSVCIKVEGYNVISVYYRFATCNTIKVIKELNIESILTLLSMHNNKYTRLRVAENKLTPQEILTYLSNDIEEMQRWSY